MPNPGICSIENCGKHVVAWGLCDAHYRRWKRHGDPLGGGTSYGEPLKFLESAKSYQGDECLIWPFGARGRGYGACLVDGKQVDVHRYICEHAHGVPPTPSHDAAHNCGNPPCISGRHLRWATRTENMDDCLIHGTRPRGERHGISKLTSEQVREIRALSGKMLQRDIGARYGVKQITISQIITRKNWGWLP